MASGAFINSSVSVKDNSDRENGKDENSIAPSIFTIVASDGLMSTLQPALEHILWYIYFYVYVSYTKYPILIKLRTVCGQISLSML